MAHRWFRRAVSALLVFCMLFADTITVFAGGEPSGRQLICGLEEHQHTDACYERVLTCGQEEREAKTVSTYHSSFKPHTHSSDCYNDAGELICGMIAGKYYHTHNAFCRNEEGKCVCGLEQKEPHKHTEECYNEDGELICTVPTTTHHHTAACFDPETGACTCGKLEIPAFTSSEANWTAEIVDAGHHHTDACYETRLVCGRQEHTHTDACYAVPEMTEEESPEETGEESAEENKAESEEKTEEQIPDAPETEAEQEQPEEGTEDPAEESAEEPVENEAGTIPETEPKEKENETPGQENRETSADNSGDETAAAEIPDDKQPETIQNEKPDHSGTEETDPQPAETEAEIPEFEIKDSILVKYNGTDETVTVPEGIRAIGTKAFAGNTKITRVVLPDSVETIKNYAFADCTKLEKVIISSESRLEAIGIGAFKNDKNLDISFADGVKVIVSNAFEGVLPEEETAIEETTEEEPAEEKTAEPAEQPEEKTEETAAAEKTEAENTEDEKAEKTEEHPEQAEIPEQPEESAQVPENEQTAAGNEAETDEIAEETATPTDLKETVPEETDPESEEEPKETEKTEEQLTFTAGIIESADTPFLVTISYDGDACIPEGTTVVVEEADAATREAAPLKLKTAPRMFNAMKATPVKEEEPRAEIASLTTWNAEAETPEIILYQKTLDISLVSEGEEIEPNPDAIITVSVALPGIKDGQAVEVRHITEEGSVLLESTNQGGVVTFTTSSFSLFSFTSTAQRITSWTSELLENTFFGKTNTQETSHSEIAVSDVTEGLTVLEAFTVTRSSDLWMTLQRIKDLVLGKLESIVLYTVEDGHLGSIVKENISLTDVLRFSLSDLSSFALVKDTGFRHKNLEVILENQSAENENNEADSVVLDGMMPKAAAAQVQEVSAVFDAAEFEETDPDETTNKNGTEKRKQAETTVLAAYDISILYDGETYQPGEEQPISVEINDSRITAEKGLELWHIKDDGTREQVKDFSLEDGKISFEATGFSVYALVHRIETYYVDAEGDTYRITVEYGDDAGLPEDVELSVSEADPAGYLTEAAEALDTQTDYLLYRKFLDISFVQKTIDEETGEERSEILEPQAPVSVSVQLMDVTDGAEALQVVHFGKDGAEKLTAETNQEAVVTFTAPSFSVFGIGNVLQPLAATETENASIEILGFSGEASLTETQAPAMEEGLEVLSAFTLCGATAETNDTTESEETEPVQETGEETTTGNHSKSLWIKANLKDNTEMSDMESVVLYTVNGEETAPLIESLTTGSQVAKLETADVAIVKDTGYRHLNLVLDMDENGQAQAQSNTEIVTTETADEQQNTTETPENEAAEGQQTEQTETAGRVIILDGMMPKEAGATAIDVTEAYADHEYVVKEEQAEETTDETDSAIEEENTEAANLEEPAQELSTATQKQPEEEPTEEHLNNVTDEESKDEANPKSEALESTEEQEEQTTRITLAAYDITISNKESEYQPDAEHPIKVVIYDSRIRAGENIELWHIRDGGTEERVEEFYPTDGKIEFVSYGFSVYTIVEAPEPPQTIQTVADLTELNNQLNDDPNTAFKLSVNRTGVAEYFTNNYNSTNHVILISSNISEAEDWYIEKSGNYYYVYKIDGTNRQYIKKNGNNLEFVNTTGQATSFEVSEAEEGTFRFKVKNEKRWLNYSGGGSGIRFWDKESDVMTGTPQNSRITLTYSSSVVVIEDDPYELDGKTYSIVYHEESVRAAGLTTTASTVSGNGLAAAELLVRPDVLYNSGELLIAKDLDLVEWTFECVSGDEYYITTIIGGNKYYLTLNGQNDLTIEAIPTAKSKITVTAGTGDFSGMYKFSVGNYSLTHTGSTSDNQWFTSSDNGANKSWMRLVTRSSLLTDEDFTVYSAEKVDISDRTIVPGYAIHPGDPETTRVVVYTRKWNDNTKKYEFYVLNSDGSVIRAYESGGVIQWVGSNIPTTEWDFTEYQYEDGTPNYYYELQNTYSGQYIAPQASGGQDSHGQILSNSTIGINLNGRRYGYYYSTILAWDDAYYSYAGLKMKDDYSGIESCSMNEADQFYFAILTPMSETDELTTVNTIDNQAHGINMKMVDFAESEMISFLGGRTNVLKQGLLSTNLNSNGYPTIVANDLSLGGMYSNTTPVNHLFIENTYYSSGYYEFDSTQNFASFYKLKDDGTYSYDASNFTVYQQLGTHEASTTSTIKHGQFLPYNKIVAGLYSTLNPLNLYSALAYYKDDSIGILPDSNPRKGEKLHLVEGSPDFFFAMELEAKFTQTVSGKDAWGHDIIYEFTGDDDFWLYVDGELVIDLGGTHSALAGSVNYRTGEVVVDGKRTNLRQIFIDNYKSRNPNATDAEVEAFLEEKNFSKVEGENIFEDYSQHTMKIFYMERGAGASNLHMRFNLASVKPGTVELSKVISGVDSTESFMADYPFQVFFKQTDEADEQPLVPDPNLGISMKFKDSTRDVPYSETFIASDGTTTITNAYLLKPGEVAVIDFPDNTYSYRIVECFVNTDIYEKVSVNDVDITNDPSYSTVVTGKRKNYDSGYKEVSEREKVTFDNHVNAQAKGVLTFNKILYAEDGTTRITQDPNVFTFRLYLGTENDTDLPLANMHSYHVKDTNGNYCKWVSGTGFVSLGKTVFDDGDDSNDGAEDNTTELTPAERLQATFATSMNGTIDKIPVDYTVEVREIPLGTKYKVEERYRELPDGYSLKRYTLNGAATGNNGKDPAEGLIVAEANSNNVVVENMKGWGVRARKVWSDDEWMANRDPTYFALYINQGGTLTMVDGTVTQLQYGEESVYWFIDKLAQNVAFTDYVPREVTITNTKPTVDIDTGIVSDPGTVTPLNVNDTVTIRGRQIGETGTAYSYTINGKTINETGTAYTYAIISYEIGDVPTGSNIRGDIITNKRAGIELYKAAWNGTTALEGAMFKLTYIDGGVEKDAGAETYTSDSNGYITTAYLRENVDYTLKEISTPAGYQGIQTALTIRRSGNDVMVSNVATTGWSTETNALITNGKYNGSIWWTLDDTDETRNTGNANFNIRIGKVTIRNKPYRLQFLKIEPESNGPLAGVTFALYPQAMDSSGNPRRDYLPVTGFDNLITDSNGIVPSLTDAFTNGTIKPGTYYLYEVTTLPQYRPLSENVKFTVSDTGIVELDSVPAGVTLETTDGTDTIVNTVTIPNALAGTVQWLYVNKVVAGVTWNDPHVFTFTAKLYLPDGMTPWPYSNTTPFVEGQVPFVNGTASFSLTDYDETVKNRVLLEVPQGAVVKVTEDATIAYDTTASIHEFEAGVHSDSIETFEYNSDNQTSTMTINDGIAVLLTYTNTRRFVNVTVKKQLDDPGKTGTFAFTGQLMDYNEDITDHIQDITDQVKDLREFSINVTNNSGTRVYRIPVRSVLTITEQPTAEQEAMYTTTYNPSSRTLSVTSASTLTVTNTRKKQTVTIIKELNDVSATGAVSFPFTVTLYNSDQTATYNSYKLNGDTIKTNNSGQATFNLSATNYVDEDNNGRASQTLTVPYGAVLKIEEGEAAGGNTYSTTITETTGSSVMSTSDKTAYVTVTDNPTIKYLNTLLQGDVNLFISKTVEDQAAGSTAGDFEFEVSGLTASTAYTYTPQTYDASTSTWVDGTEDSKTADTDGKLTFILKHHTRVAVKIPVGTEVTVTETNSNGFTPSYKVTHGDSVPGSSVSSNSVTITMNGHKTVDFTNTKGSVAPTHYSSRYTPWLLILLFGLMILIGGVGFMGRKGRNDAGPDNDGTSAIDATPTNTGPPGGQIPPVIMTEPAKDRTKLVPARTNSTTDSVSHIRWRNRALDENRDFGPQRGYIAPKAKEIPCPRANMWGGDAG